MGKAEENKKKKYETLLNTAFDLFTAKGLNNTSISDIVERAGVAKGTFYLYFKDKYDIRSRLIVHRASKLFVEAHEALLNEDTDDFTDKLIFIVNHILDRLNEDKGLLALMHKDLSWAVFKKDLTSRSYEYEIDFYEDVYRKMILKSGLEFREPEIMLSMIVELAGSAGYSSIMYNEPVPLDELKPYLADAIRAIIGLHTLK
jgi:AcrR family transcriptional regulator